MTNLQTIAKWLDLCGPDSWVEFSRTEEGVRLRVAVGFQGAKYVQCDIPIDPMLVELRPGGMVRMVEGELPILMEGVQMNEEMPK